MSCVFAACIPPDTPRDTHRVEAEVTSRDNTTNYAMHPAKSGELWMTEVQDIPRGWSAEVGLYHGNGPDKVATADPQPSHRSEVYLGDTYSDWPSEKVAVCLCTFGAQKSQWTPYAHALIAFAKVALPYVNEVSLSTLLSALINMPMCGDALPASEQAAVKRWLETSCEASTSPCLRLFLCLVWLVLAYKKKDTTIAAGLQLSEKCRRSMVRSIGTSLDCLVPPVNERLLKPLLVNGGLEVPWVFHLDHFIIFSSSDELALQKKCLLTQSGLVEWLDSDTGVRLDQTRAKSVVDRLKANMQLSPIQYLRVSQKILANHPAMLSRCVNDVRKETQSHPAPLAVTAGLVKSSKLGEGTATLTTPDTPSHQENSFFRLWCASSHRDVLQLLLEIAASCSQSVLLCRFMTHNTEQLLKAGYKTELSLQWVMDSLATPTSSKPLRNKSISESCQHTIARLTVILATPLLSQNQQLRKELIKRVHDSLENVEWQPHHLFLLAMPVTRCPDDVEEMIGQLARRLVAKVTWTPQLTEECLGALLDKQPTSSR